MGNRILILGGSEVGLSCARILDLQGFDIRLVHAVRLKTEPEMPQEIAAGRLTPQFRREHDYVPEAAVDGIRGHLGDFQVTVEGKTASPQMEGRYRLPDRSEYAAAGDSRGMFGLKKFYRFNFAFFHTPQIGVYRVMPRTLTRVSPISGGARPGGPRGYRRRGGLPERSRVEPAVDPDAAGVAAAAWISVL